MANKIESFCRKILNEELPFGSVWNPCSTWRRQRNCLFGATSLLDQPKFPDSVDASPTLCSESGQLHISSWIGTGGTRTPLHFDSLENMLIQVVGAKYIRVYDSAEADKLYVIRNASGSSYAKQGNMIVVDYEAEDWEMKPMATNAKFEEALPVVLPGDCVYFPAGAWHHVCSLSATLSIKYLR